MMQIPFNGSLSHSLLAFRRVTREKLFTIGPHNPIHSVMEIIEIDSPATVYHKVVLIEVERYVDSVTSGVASGIANHSGFLIHVLYVMEKDSDTQLNWQASRQELLLIQKQRIRSLIKQPNSSRHRDRAYLLLAAWIAVVDRNKGHTQL